MVASSSVQAAGLPKTKRRTTWRTRLRNIAAKSAAPSTSAQRCNLAARLFDGVDALKHSPRPFLRVPGFQVRRLHRLPERVDVGSGDGDTLPAKESDQLFLLAL